MSKRQAIPQGTLDMLILGTLASGGRQHGFEIANSIAERSKSVLLVEEGSLYPALQRLLVEGWIAGEWDMTEGNRRARYYQLTAAGRKQLAKEVKQYRSVSAAIGKILEPA
jgi:PadR family transcriptional regulator, regulatory protein PadR